MIKPGDRFVLIYPTENYFYGLTKGRTYKVIDVYNDTIVFLNNYGESSRWSRSAVETTGPYWLPGPSRPKRNLPAWF